MDDGSFECSQCRRLQFEDDFICGTCDGCEVCCECPPVDDE